MKKTEKLGLNILEGTDPVSVEGFNENAQLLDDIVSRKANAAYGTWVGDGTDNKTLTFETKPLLVFVQGSLGTAVCIRGGIYAFHHNFTYSQLTTRPITWDGNSLVLQESGYFNRQNEDYIYIAFLEN